MQWSRRSISWTSFSSPWVRARDSNRDVDLAVGRPIVPAHTGRGYRVPRYVVFILTPVLSACRITDHDLQKDGCAYDARGLQCVRAPPLVGADLHGGSPLTLKPTSSTYPVLTRVASSVCSNCVSAAARSSSTFSDMP